VKRSINAQKKRRKALDEARGYWGLKSSSYRRAKEQLIKSGTYAYRDRRARKRDFRRLVITRIKCRRQATRHELQPVHPRSEGCGYRNRSQDLGDLAVREPEVFAQMAARAKEALGTN
jgi:large subunit ribosomal protein L20